MGLINTSRSGFIIILLLLFWGTTAALIWWPGKPTPAPEVNLELTDGRHMTLSQLRPRVVVLNFWASTCTICVREFPQLEELRRNYRARGVEVIGVVMFYDSPANAMRLVQAMGLEIPMTLDIRAEIAGAFGGIRGTPTTFVIDGHGMIRAYTQGRLDFDDLRQTLDTILAETPPAPEATTVN
ncbi:MAG TPA: TlpA family protein disulfide reductase [Gammaproteobacteria bacterium]|nr:TlpA family protein disulfide reductase [Gammaproteobacteria bacterium]